MRIKIDKIYRCDCIDLMSEMLREGITADYVITDPPYGIGEDGLKNHSRSGLAEATKFMPKKWDRERPSKEAFDLMRKVSKHQVIFGGNYFADMLPPSSCWLVWDKLNGKSDFADCELAWTSFNTSVRRFAYRWAGMLQGNMKAKEKRLHPTQKPLPLIEWILNTYTKPGELIADFYSGSGTVAVACHKLKRHFISCEKDQEYYSLSVDRLEGVKAQISIYDLEE